jgi:uncharacterized protein with NRDE domain
MKKMKSKSPENDPAVNLWVQHAYMVAPSEEFEICTYSKDNKKVKSILDLAKEEEERLAIQQPKSQKRNKNEVTIEEVASESDTYSIKSHSVS